MELSSSSHSLCCLVCRYVPHCPLIFYLSFLVFTEIAVYVGRDATRYKFLLLLLLTFLSPLRLHCMTYCDLLSPYVTNTVKPIYQNILLQPLFLMIFFWTYLAIQTSFLLRIPPRLTTDRLFSIRTF